MPKKSEKYLAALGIYNLRKTLLTFNPWWKTKTFTLEVPTFQRDVFKQALHHVEAVHGLGLLVNGPRRVGKTTLIYQLIRNLIQIDNVKPSRILFFSLDDPIVQQLPAEDQGALFESVLAEWAQVAGTALRTSPQPLYCFLDEIQRLPRWELYLKRYIDLRYPIKFVISGSASHTIFRKSLESLLGRLVEISLPPFTFREFVRFHYPDEDRWLSELASTSVDLGSPTAMRDFARAVEESASRTAMREWLARADAYASAGGFPQLWGMSNSSERAAFVDEQFVRRVTLEDLRLVKEIRRPEIFHQFLRYAFARTGEEYNLEQLAGLIKTTRVTLTEALPLLLQTELIRKVERFTGKPVRLRSTHAKLYAADPILMQAITKIPTSLEGEERGRIAETLVHNVLRAIPGVSDISYYREPRGLSEIDFIVRVGSDTVPVEVCFRGDLPKNHIDSVSTFLAKHHKRGGYGVVITKERLDISLPIIQLPLPYFLLAA